MTDDRCGTAYGYAVHVKERTEKCEPCRRAHAVRAHTYYVRRYVNRGRPLLIDSTGTRRRLQALSAIGWADRTIGDRCGVTKTAVRQWRSRGRVHPVTAQRVRDLYDELWDVPGPNPKTALYARSVGWVPPLAWDDDDIDDPAARPMHDLRGHNPGHPRDADREAQVLYLTRCGLSAAEIAVRLRTSTRQVVRIRSRNRQEDVA